MNTTKIVIRIYLSKLFIRKNNRVYAEHVRFINLFGKVKYSLKVLRPVNIINQERDKVVL